MPLMLAKACRDLADINWNQSRSQLFNRYSFYTNTHNQNTMKDFLMSKWVPVAPDTRQIYQDKYIFILQWVSIPLALHWMKKNNRFTHVPGKIAFILIGVRFQLHQMSKRHVNHCAWNYCLRIETEPVSNDTIHQTYISRHNSTIK